MKHLSRFLTAVGMLAIICSASAQPKVAQPFEKAVKLDVAISKPANIKGGDYDDKTQRIAVKVKLTNKELRQSYEGYKATVSVLGQSAVEKDIRKVLLSEKFDVALLPSKTVEHSCEEIMTRFDKTGLAYGYFYDGWIVVIHDPAQQIVWVKSNLTALEKFPGSAEKLALHGCYDRKLNPVKDPARNGSGF